MKLSDKNFSAILAGVYVLGSLQGPARRRFERELRRDRGLEAEVGRWEARFQPLMELVPPERPPRRVWEAIQAQLGPKLKQVGFWQRLSFWRPLALVTSAAAISLLIFTTYSVYKPTVEPAKPLVALLSDQKAEAGWFLTLQPEKKTLQVKVVTPPKVAADKSLELWMLPGKDQAPISLGLLPVSGTKTLPIPEDKLKILLAAAGLAVSLEPSGGSPTGAPTGPVLYQGSLMSVL